MTEGADETRPLLLARVSNAVEWARAARSCVVTVILSDAEQDALLALLASAPAPAAERVEIRQRDEAVALLRELARQTGRLSPNAKIGKWLIAYDAALVAPLPPAEPPQEPPSFKEGVAYMPVPRCETCKHWEYFTPESESLPDYGLCNNTTSFSGLLALAIREDAWMHKSFGCVQWELKPAEPPQGAAMSDLMTRL